MEPGYKASVWQVLVDIADILRQRYKTIVRQLDEHVEFTK